LQPILNFTFLVNQRRASGFRCVSNNQAVTILKFYSVIGEKFRHAKAIHDFVCAAFKQKFSVF